MFFFLTTPAGLIDVTGSSVLPYWNGLGCFFLVLQRFLKFFSATFVLWPNLFWVRPPCPAQGIVCFYARISNTPSSQSQNNCWRMTRTICELTWTNKCHHFSNCFLKDFEKWLCQGFRKGLLWDVKRPWCALVYLCIGKIWNSLDTKLWTCRKI